MKTNKFKDIAKRAALSIVAVAFAIGMLFSLVGSGGDVQAQQQPNTFTGVGLVTTIVQNQAVAATVVPFSSTWTNKIAASTAFGNMTPIDLRGLNGDVWLELNAYADAAGTGLFNLMLGANLSGLNASTNATSSTNVTELKLIGMALAGTTQSHIVTNLTSLFGGAGKAPPFLFFNYLTNADGTANVTNYSVRIYRR